MTTTLPEEHRDAIETLWNFHQMHHQVRPSDVGIGLGSHDPTVPMVAVELFGKGMFPYVVFTGANAPTTIERYPRGEAVHYAEYAVEHGIPEDLVLKETQARTTAENITLTRALLQGLGRHPRTAVVMSRPYQQRRAYTICRKLWPELDVVCASTQLPLDDYVTVIGDADRVINMMVGDLQRLGLDYTCGLAIATAIPPQVSRAYADLVRAGYTTRLIATA